MAKRKLKKSAYPILYGMLISCIMGSLFIIDAANSKIELANDFNYVSKTVFDNVIPVVSEKKTVVMKPFLDTDVKEVTLFYKDTDEAAVQQKSLIYYEGTYMPSTGITYQKDITFDVVSILNGTVIEVKEDQILGKVLKVRHENDLISVYQSLSDITVKQDDIVTQGQVIAKSGVSNLQKELGNNMHFELIKDGINVNPNDYYDKNIEEI